METENGNRFARLVVGSRVLRGCSLREASESAGVNASYLSSIEKSGSKVPSLEWITRIAHALGCPWLSASAAESMFLGTAWFTWSRPEHFGRDTLPPMSTIWSLADRLAQSVASTVGDPLPSEWLSENAREHAWYALFESLSSSYRLPGLSGLVGGHALEDAAVVVAMAGALLSGGRSAAQTVERHFSLGRAESIMDMLCEQVPEWIATSKNESHDYNDTQLAEVVARWPQLRPDQREILVRLVESWGDQP